MAFNMVQEEGNFFMPAGMFDQALAAIQKEIYEFSKYTCFLEALEKEACFEIDVDRAGNIASIQFKGDKFWSKMKSMFEALAFCVESGCYLQFRGEDESRWRWCFENGEVIEKTARTTWV